MSISTRSPSQIVSRSTVPTLELLTLSRVIWCSQALTLSRQSLFSLSWPLTTQCAQRSKQLVLALRSQLLSRLLHSLTLTTHTSFGTMTQPGLSSSAARSMPASPKTARKRSLIAGDGSLEAVSSLSSSSFSSLCAAAARVRTTELAAALFFAISEICANL